MWEKRCKKGTRKDWKKLAHVTEFNYMSEETFLLNRNLLNPLIFFISLFLTIYSSMLHWYFGFKACLVSDICTTPTYLVTLKRCIFWNYYWCLSVCGFRVCVNIVSDIYVWWFLIYWKFGTLNAEDHFSEWKWWVQFYRFIQRFWQDSQCFLNELNGI
jgi:hypothetical protein